MISLKLFPEIWFDYYRDIPSSFTILFSCLFFPISPSNFYIHFNLVYPVVLGLPLDNFPSNFVRSIFLDILSSPIRITCPNYLHLLVLMLFFFSSIPCSNRILVFLILSFFVLFEIALGDVISIA